MNCALAGTRASAAVVKTGLEVEGCWAVGLGEQVLDMVSQLSRGSDFKGGACAGHTLVPSIFLLTPSGHVPGFTTTTFLG